MDVNNLKNIASESELNKRGRVLARIGEVNVCVSRFSQHPKWEIHPNGEEVLVGISGELNIVILDAANPKTVFIKPGDVAIIPQNTWHSPIPNGEVSVLNMGNMMEHLFLIMMIHGYREPKARKRDTPSRCSQRPE